MAWPGPCVNKRQIAICCMLAFSGRSYMRTNFNRLSFLLTLLSFAAFAADQKAKVLDKETYFQMESIATPSISPDGSQIVFSRGWADVMKDQEQANLWLVDISGQRPRELTQGAWRDSAAAW